MDVVLLFGVTVVLGIGVACVDVRAQSRVELPLSARLPGLSLPDTVYLGLVRLSTCDSLTLPMTNTGSDTIQIDSVRLMSLHPEFTLVLPRPEPFILPPGRSDSLQLRYCALDTGCRETRLKLFTRNLSTDDPLVEEAGILACGGAAIIDPDPLRLDFGPVTLGECDTLDLTLSNRGNYPLHIVDMILEGEGLAFVEPVSIPLTIRPGETVVIPIAFCPVEERIAAGSIRLRSNADSGASRIELQGHGVRGKLNLPRDMDFGYGLIGICRDSGVVLTNGGLGRLTLTEIGWGDLLQNHAITLQNIYPPGWRRTLQAGDTLQIPIEYCPDEADVVQRLLIVRHTLGSDTMLFRGSGVHPGVRFDSVEINAGEIAHVVCRFGENVPAIPGTYRLLVSYDELALYPVNADPGAAGDVVRFENPEPGFATVEIDLGSRSGGGDVLATISFRGLASGRPVNYLDVASIITPLIGASWETGRGVIRMNGCEVGNALPAGRRAVIEALRPNPTTDRVDVTLILSEQSQPILTLYDVRGATVRRYEVPAGIGGRQTMPLLLDTLPGGMYVVELNDRGELSRHKLVVE